MSEGFNAADRKDVRAAEKAARLAQREREDVVRNLCSTQSGRRFVWDKLSLAGIFVALPPTDALAMAFAEGVRAQGLSLLNDIITACPDQFIKMMQESNERNLSSASTREQRSSEDRDGFVDRSDEAPDLHTNGYDDNGFNTRPQVGVDFEA